MKANQKILFIYTGFSTFVRTDYEILAKKNNVKKYHFKATKGLIATSLALLKQFFFLLPQIWKFDSVYIWFADTHSFLPVLFGQLFHKKSFVVIGGYDVARIPALNYGVFTSKIRGFCAIYSMKNSTLNLTVSNYVDRKVRWLTKSENTKMIYNCVNLPNSEDFNKNKENTILTVGLINNSNTFYLKGIDTFIEAAKLLPDFNFQLIGAEKSLIKRIVKELPENLNIVGRTDHKQLIDYYKKAKIYCQFSRSESFGVSIVEAMNFGCIPVVTNIGGMPELVEELGVIVNRDINQIGNTISELIGGEKNYSYQQNRNVLTQFLFETREKDLLKTISDKVKTEQIK